MYSVHVHGWRAGRRAGSGVPGGFSVDCKLS